MPHLSRNIAANKLANTQLEAIAVGEHTGTIGLRSGINSGIVDSGQAAYSVPIQPLDSVVSGRVDFLKIDVEGFELDVLRGSSAVLQRDRPTLFLEVHPWILPRFGATLTGLISEVRGVYPDFEIYHLPASSQSLIPKPLERYLQRNPLICVADVDAFLGNIAACSEFEQKTFWIVARSPCPSTR